MKKTISSILIVSALASIPTLALADSNRGKGNDKKFKIEYRHHDDRKKSSSSTPKVSKIESSRINTYSDISSALAGLATTTQSLKLSATTTASTTLSAAELALFAKLSPKGTKAENVNQKADKIIAEINSLQAFVAPLGTQTITTNFGLKDLLVKEVNRIVSQINSLSKLSSTIK